GSLWEHRAGRRSGNLLGAGTGRHDDVRRTMMTATVAAATDLNETSASWRAIGTSVHLIVTEPAALEPACRMLHADLAAVDAACSRFRADSEVGALDRVPQWRGRARPVNGSPHR